MEYVVFTLLKIIFKVSLIYCKKNLTIVIFLMQIKDKTISMLYIKLPYTQGSISPTSYFGLQTTQVLISIIIQIK